MCFSSHSLCRIHIIQKNALNSEVAELREALANRDTILQMQNEAILQKALEVENYKKAQEQVKEKIITR